MSALILVTASTPAGSEEVRPALGQPASEDLLHSWNLSVFPDGRGLPDGSGDASTGQQLYQQHCIACHAEGGAGGSGDRLANAEMGLTDEYPQKTIGNFWPYATTLFDFIRRAKPMGTPGSLTNDEIYALTAYLLHINGLIVEDAVMNKESLPQVTMPNKDGFIDVWKDDSMNTVR